MTVGWLPGPAEELFGPDATAEESYEVLTVDVPPASWTAALQTARDTLGCTYFDWLSAVDEPGTGFRVSAHVVALSPLHRLLVRTTVPHTAPVLASAVSVYAGAAWHERETHEMFGVAFEGHPGLDPLLLPEGFEGHPLRKDFVLAARVAKAWPGAKEPGESEHGGPKRRQMLPPGVPDPNEWGPLKGQLPPAPARPARGAARPAGDRPVRRTRTAGEGSASQTAATAATPTPAAGTQTPAAGTQTPAAGTAGAEAASGTTGAEAARPVRRSRSASQGSASQRAQETPPPAPTPTAEPTPAAEPTAEPTPAAEPTTGSEPTPAPEPTADSGPATRPARRPATPRGSDAPWHQPKPAFDDAEPKPKPVPESAPETKPVPRPETTSESQPEPDAQSKTEPDPRSKPDAQSAPEPDSRTEPESQPAPEPRTEPEPRPERESQPEREPHPEQDPTPESAPGSDSTPAPSPDDPSGGTQ
ncbi:NADH-quinone oxidoreductase subunit C [Streptomyces aureus]